MPSTGLHNDQYKHNWEFYQHGIQDKNKYLDWSITALFYTAVHLIEMLLACKGNHPDNHDQRKVLVNQLDECRSFRVSYKDLYKQSRIARYDCIYPKPKDLHSCELDLFHIKDCVLTNME